MVILVVTKYVLIDIENLNKIKLDIKKAPLKGAFHFIKNSLTQ
jgi:uncharacterized protein (DUF488 family)